MAPGFSATISGMVADRYAEVFSNADYFVLLYDHRNFGQSDGEPRQEINEWIQARGYRDAITFVMSLPEITTSIFNKPAESGHSRYVGWVIQLVKRNNR